VKEPAPVAAPPVRASAPPTPVEEAPAELLPFTPPGSAAGSSWGKRMVAFLARLEDPAFHSQSRWAGVDPEIGDEARDF